MKRSFKKFMLMSIFLFMAVQSAFAQSSPDFIDMMRQGGKIYVVYLLLGVILLGVLIYMILLERRLARLEKQLKIK